MKAWSLRGSKAAALLNASLYCSSNSGILYPQTQSSYQGHRAIAPEWGIPEGLCIIRSQGVSKTLEAYERAGILSSKIP